MLPTGVDAPASIGSVLSVEALTHNAGNAATGGIWRILGRSGRAVLKIAQPPNPDSPGTGMWQTSTDPRHWNYWCREALAYRAGLPQSAYADAGIAAPSCLDTVELPGGRIALWLNDVGGRSGWTLDVPALARFAYRLGVGQARHAHRIPDQPWLSTDWLGQYLAGAGGWLTPMDWDHPVLAPWPTERLRRLWPARDTLRAAAARGVPTLCHLDLWPSNLLEVDGSPVLVDWASCGAGVLGEDLANLILDSVNDGLLPAEWLPEIDSQCTDAYVAGLADGGWAGDPDGVRRTVAACGAAKYAWLPAGFGSRATRAESAGNPHYARAEAPEQFVARLTGVVTLLANWAERTLFLR